MKVLNDQEAAHHTQVSIIILEITRSLSASPTPLPQLSLVDQKQFILHSQHFFSLTTSKLVKLN